MKQKIKYVKKIEILTLLLHVIAIVFMAYFSAGALRQNNLKMLELRQNVFIADETGFGLDAALKNLRNFVSSHMNTKLPKLGDEKAIQLKYSYERAVSAEQARYKDEELKLSAEAKANCSGLKNVSQRVDCEQTYIKKNPVKPLSDIFPETYSLEFVSPIWSFDIAGWSIVASVLVFVLFVARVAALLLARRTIKKSYK